MKGRTFNFFQLPHSQVSLDWEVGKPAGAPASGSMGDLQQQLRCIWEGVQCVAKLGVKEREIGIREVLGAAFVRTIGIVAASRS